MAKDNVLIVMKRDSAANELDLWGVFSNKQTAINSIEHDDFFDMKIHLFPILDFPELGEGLNTEGDWQAIINAGVDYDISDINSVWGYINWGRVQ